mmetsp:Transcript_12913/g.18525  ORF Transcript_12913/g.18525 Transcript_12913/m.18525 type:complete len:84 (+) Transcript_12913:1796-2047(+)
MADEQEVVPLKIRGHDARIETARKIIVSVWMKAADGSNSNRAAAVHQRRRGDDAAHCLVWIRWQERFSAITLTVAVTTYHVIR